MAASPVLRRAPIMTREHQAAPERTRRFENTRVRQLRASGGSHESGNLPQVGPTLLAAASLPASSDATAAVGRECGRLGPKAEARGEWRISFGGGSPCDRDSQLGLAVGRRDGSAPSCGQLSDYPGSTRSL